MCLKHQKVSILKILFYRTIKEHTIHIFNNILYIQYFFNLITIFYKWENTKTKKKEDNKGKSYSSDKGIKYGDLSVLNQTIFQEINYLNNLINLKIQIKNHILFLKKIIY